MSVSEELGLQYKTKQEAMKKELYKRYETDGFIKEDETLAYFAEHQIPLTLVDSITDHLLSMGVLIKAEGELLDNEEDIYDRTRTDYEAVFLEVLQISPGLSLMVDYIKTIKPPQHREWHILIPQAQSGNQYARDRLFDMYLRVVLKIALKYHKESGYEIDDIIQVGAMGLLKAIKAYDGTKQGSFVSYMPLWIAQFISRAITDLSRIIRIPAHMQETMRMIEHTTAILHDELARKPMITELAFECNMTEKSVEQILSFPQKAVPIDKVLTIDEDGFCSFEIEDNQTLPIEVLAEENELSIIINDLLDLLTKKEVGVIRARFGFDDGCPKTLEKIGESYGVTRERIRQIEAKAIRKLKMSSKHKKLDGYYTKETQTKKTP